MLKLQVNIKQLMKEKNITQLKLSELTGIRQAAISELINMKRQSININHLEAIINVLRVKDISKYMEIIEEE
ncbi:helix-turn-helix domain-containing protein [Metabacillus sp. Hm71]|uniref:helix-turn-helix domain-containing protein n=1 Tax=Metabacillus sp. Hm71 TaxID=3450743 RepID=UPI003F430112